MKKVILLCSLFALFVFSFAWAYRTNLGSDDGLKVELISADVSKVKVEIKLPEIVVEDKLVEGETYQMITIPGGGWLTQVGSPQIPLVCRFVALPPTSGVSIKVVEEEKETLPGTFLVYPFQKPPTRGDNQEPEVFQLNHEIYSQNRAFPGNLVELGEISILRDLRIAPIKFFPVQFNPQTGEVTVYKRLVVDIHFEGIGENPKLNPRNVLTRTFLETYESFVLNFDQIKAGKDVVDGSILIITYDSFHDQVQPLADWKHKRGISTHLVNLSSIGSTSTQIYNYIYSAYHTWPDPPEYVILVGDIGQIPTNNGLTCITDHKYVTVDGSDYFADIHIGRISVQTPAEAAHVITKTLNYRKNPYIGQTEWFMRGMTISGSDYVDDYNALICGNFMVNYAGFTYFDSLWESLGTDTPTQISTRLNQGRSWIAYFGHGSSTSWIPSGFSNSHIDALNNGEKLPAIFSVACDNGGFDYYGGDCFAEKWTKVGSVGNEKGAIIICASTRGSQFFYSDTLGRGTFKAYFADSLFHFTPAVNQGKMFMYTYFPEGPGGTTEREMQMYTTFGDPELDPWSGVPESLDVIHPDIVLIGGGDFTVAVQLNGQPLKDALVCLIKDSEVYESARTGPDGQVTLTPAPATPGTMDVTVTGHNAYPYETTIQVISPSGPYLVYLGSTIDDDALGESQGNSDGDVDIGETIELPVVLKNLGDSTAIQASATLSTADFRITITDGYEEYGDIPAGQSASCLDDFDFSISPEIPDGEIITFNLEMTAENGTEDWNYPSLDIEVHAPVLMYQSGSIDDIVGNGDGGPDAGEVCNLDIVLENDGSHEAAAVDADLICHDFYVNVLNSSSSYPDIPPQGNSTSLSSYRFQVRTDCPEGHNADFILHIHAADSYSTTDTFQIVIGQTPVLLVDDDGGEDYQTYFETTLDSSHIPYEVWTHASLGTPSVSDLELYKAVIWTTADDYGSSGSPATLTGTDQASLMSYLDGGGKLFLSSQDVLYDNGLNTFVTDYLHVSEFLGEKGIKSVAGVTGDTITHGMAFGLSYPFYNFSDYIMPGAGATGIFSRTGMASPTLREGGFAKSGGDFFSGSGLIDYCALRYPASGSATYQVVFFSFPFEAIPQAGADPNNAQVVLERILNWFGVKKPSPPSFMHGDANGDQMLDLTDVLFLISYLYKNGYPPTPLDAGDANCDGLVDLTDVLYLISYLYKGGPTPPC